MVGGDAEIDGGCGRDGGDWRDGCPRARQCSRVSSDLRANRASRARLSNSISDSADPLHDSISARMAANSGSSWRRTRVAIPPRPLFGHETAPISSVRAIQSDGGSRIVVEVIGKSDYAIARLRDRNEIVLRVATDRRRSKYRRADYRSQRSRRARPAPIRRASGRDSRRRRIRVAVSVAPPIAPAPVASNEDNRQPGHFLVMIDPGHGGYDPGTQSSAGVAGEGSRAANRDAAQSRSGSPRHPRRAHALDRRFHQPGRAHPNCE